MPRKDNFARGFFCAVAVLLRSHGMSTEARELFELGGDPAKADPSDIETFIEHGLMGPANPTTKD